MHYMTIDNNPRDEERRNNLHTDVKEVDPRCKVRNLKRAERYGYYRKKERIDKYGMDNYLAYHEDIADEPAA